MNAATDDARFFIRSAAVVGTGARMVGTTVELPCELGGLSEEEPDERDVREKEGSGDGDVE